MTYALESSSLWSTKRNEFSTAHSDRARREDHPRITHPRRFDRSSASLCHHHAEGAEAPKRPSRSQDETKKNANRTEPNRTKQNKANPNQTKTKTKNKNKNKTKQNKNKERAARLLATPAIARARRARGAGAARRPCRDGVADRRDVGQARPGASARGRARRAAAAMVGCDRWRGVVGGVTISGRGGVLAIPGSSALAVPLGRWRRRPLLRARERRLFHLRRARAARAAVTVAPARIPPGLAIARTRRVRVGRVGALRDRDSRIATGGDRTCRRDR